MSPEKKLIKKAQEKQVPDWVTDYFSAAYDAQVRLLQVVSVSQRGIGGLTSMPRLVKALARVRGSHDDAESKNLLQAAEEDAALAHSEIKEDFPVLHALATVGLWSWLEHLVKGLATEWLVHNKHAIQSPALQRLRVRVVDYVSLSKREQVAYLIDLLEQETASPLKRGVNRFEGLLEPFSLSGSVPEATSKSLFELQQIRNAIAHQNGKCDRRLKESCPWLKLKLGSPVRVGTKQMNAYAAASTDYALTVIYRMGDLYGKDLRGEGSGT